MNRVVETQPLPQDLYGFFKPNSPVAISFWIISISMVAAKVFFLMDSMMMSGHWKMSMNVSSLVTLVAAVHYFNKYVEQYFSNMRLIVIAGWSIYPLGYFFGHLVGADVLSLVYNVADFVNRIAFCLAICQVAKNSTVERKNALLPAWALL